MKEVKLNGHVFEFYDDIAEMPIARFHSYSRYMLVAGGIGDTLADIDAHIARISQLMSIDTKKASQELLNLRQCLFLVANERDIKHKAFLYLTKTVDGKEWEDFSEVGIDKLYALINGETLQTADEAMSDVINAIDTQLAQYFPKIFNSSVEKNISDLLRKRALLQIDEMTTGSDHKDEIEEITKDILSRQTIKNFENDEAVVEFDKQFEDMCLVLSKEFSSNAKKYSVMEFYSAYVMLEKRGEEMKKIYKKKR